MRVGIQGVRAAFHEVAARKYFVEQASKKSSGSQSSPDPDLEIVECSTFRALCEALRDGRADACLMAIENSIAGSILGNYGLLETFRFKIIGEVYLRIEMCLMALPGEAIADLESVQSHPMAILQCEDFLLAHPHIKVMESLDTAESAKLIASRKLKKTGAIASRLAAEMYGLDVLAAGIETNQRNYTRFLVITRRPSTEATTDTFASHLPAPGKTSIRFELAHRPGALVEVLEAFRDENVNLTKIQSVPILGRPTEYSFHVDVEWVHAEQGRRALEKVTHLTHGLIHFGNYPPAHKPF